MNVQSLFHNRASCMPSNSICPKNAPAASISPFRHYSTGIYRSPPEVLARRPRRILFNVPASDYRKIEKASTYDLDVVVLDLEDGTSPNQKQRARENIGNALRDISFGRSEKCVRINAFGSGLEEMDLNSLVPSLSKLDSILLPKVEEPEHLRNLVDFLTSNNASHIKILGAIESSHALINLKAICEETKHLDCIVFGSEDYAADAGMIRTKGLEEMVFARSTIVAHAAAYSLQAIDLVCIDYKNLEQLEKECISGLNMGYDGKQAIHPGQIPVIYKNFRPPEKIIQMARNILSEYNTHMQAGKGAFVMNDFMIDMPMIKWAKKILTKINELPH